MPDQEPVESPSILNEPPKETPAEKTPEEKLFPNDKPAETKPDATANKGDAPKPEPIEPKPVETKPEEKPKEEPKPTSDSKPSTADNKSPIDYESLKLPEGSLLSNDELAFIKKEAKEQGLSLEEVQGVLEVKNDAVKAFLARQNQSVQAAQKEWKEAWLKDPEYGGDKLKESTELAKRAWDRFADSELKKLADQTGFGNHPSVLRMMARIGKLMSEDRLVRGQVGGAPEKKSPEEILYGKTTPTNNEVMA